MIAAIEWIPSGRANPNPSKYEYSRAEQEFLSRIVSAQQEEGGDDGDGDGDNVGESDVNNKDDDDVDSDSDDDAEKNEVSTEEKKKKVELPKVDPKSLPDDLNMDDYSDDDNDNDTGGREKTIGNLLVGKVCVCKSVR